MDGCIYRTKDGECDLYSEDGKYHAWCDMNGCDGRRMSNGDRIRAMTDEELAKFMSDDLCELLQCPDVCDGHCDKKLVKWLKEEVKE